MHASNYHSYTHLIQALGIVRKPTVWVFITSKYHGTHDIGLPNNSMSPPIQGTHEAMNTRIMMLSVWRERAQTQCHSQVSVDTITKFKSHGPYAIVWALSLADASSTTVTAYILRLTTMRMHECVHNRLLERISLAPTT